MLICKTIREKKKVWHKSKESSITNTNGEKWVHNMSKGKNGDFEVINLDLKTPPSVPSLVEQGRPLCHSPKTIRKSLFMPLLDSGRHEIGLTLGYLVFR